MKKATLSPKITIDFPYIQKSDDYYEFDQIKHQHESLLGRKIKFAELGCTGYHYWAVFYIDENELTIQDIKELLKKSGRTENQIKNFIEDLKL